MNVYPVFLNDLKGRRCVVFGNGHDAPKKVRELLDCEADVTVISPQVEASVEALAAAGRLAWEARTYAPGDLRGAFLALVTETNPAATAPIWEEARAERVLMSAVDDVPHCSFVAGSVVRRGPLVLAVSTSGCAPAQAVRIRQALEAAYGPEYGAFVALLGALRPAMAEHLPDFETRRRKWYEVVDSDARRLLAEGRVEEAFALIDALVGAPVTAAG